MTGALLRPTSLVECAVAMTPLPGETESGDRCLVLPTRGGALVAVIDGLGHGSQAALAADVAVQTLEAHLDESVVALIQLCHQRMQSTRGAAISLASFNRSDQTLTWVGVGNVAGVLLRKSASEQNADESVLLRAGVVGFQLPLLQSVKVPVAMGDVLIFATDGIRADFSSQVSRKDRVQRIADRISETCSRDNDDALVLVVRYTGAGS